jgi:hypothetical protein
MGQREGMTPNQEEEEAWPEGEVTAEDMKAFKEGAFLADVNKPLEECIRDGIAALKRYRKTLAPPDEKPAWTMPAPPAGMQWHRDDFTPEMLPNGYRPLLMGEPCQSGDEVRYMGTWNNDVDTGFAMTHLHLHTRTTRPLPSPPSPTPQDSREAKTAEREGLSEIFADARSAPCEAHITPPEPCPLCGSSAQFVELTSSMVWMCECTKCGLALGLPNGYSSRLDLCDAWNERAAIAWSQRGEGKKLCRKCFGKGIVEIYNGPYFQNCDACEATGFIQASLAPVEKQKKPSIQFVGHPVDFENWWKSSDWTYGGDATPRAIAGIAWEAAHKLYVLDKSAPPAKEVGAPCDDVAGPKRPLTARDEALIGAAWKKHVAAGPPCKLPPPGWKCTRGAGHEGPCAATPQVDEIVVLSEHVGSDQSGRFVVEELREDGHVRLSNGFWYHPSNLSAAPSASLLEWNNHQVSGLQEKVKGLEMSRDSWKADAERYAANADYWKARAEKAEAMELEQSLRIIEALNEAGAPMDEVDGMCPMTFVERIQWLHTEKGLADARLKDIEKVYKEQLAAMTKERDALRSAFAEASHNAGPAFVAHEELKRVTKERDGYKDDLFQIESLLPDDSPCKHEVTGHSLYDDIHDLIRDKAKADVRVKEVEKKHHEDVEMLKREADRLRVDLQEIAKGCGVGVPDQEDAKRRIIAIREERDKLKSEVERISSEAWAKQCEYSKLYTSFTHAKREADTLRQELADEKRTHGWVSVKDRMPTKKDADKFGYILKYGPTSVYLSFWNAPHIEDDLWMPIPPLPSTESGGEKPSPSPENPDPWAKEKEAFAKGYQIQHRYRSREGGEWSPWTNTIGEPKWFNHPCDEYRIHPDDAPKAKEKQERAEFEKWWNASPCQLSKYDAAMSSWFAAKEAARKEGA